MSKEFGIRQGSTLQRLQRSTFDRFDQATAARRAQVEAARTVYLDSVVTSPISDISKTDNLASRRGPFSSRGLVFAAGVGGIGLLIAACGGGGEANNPTLTASPETGTPVATAVKPTEKPTVVPTSEATPELKPLTQDGLKADLADMFGVGPVPTGVCDLNLMQGLVDQQYANYGKLGYNNGTIALGLATISREVKKFGLKTDPQRVEKLQQDLRTTGLFYYKLDLDDAVKAGRIAQSNYDSQWQEFVKGWDTQASSPTAEGCGFTLDDK